jgi:hypothetical protein
MPITDVPQEKLAAVQTFLAHAYPPPHFQNRTFAEPAADWQTYCVDFEGAELARVSVTVAFFTATADIPATLAVWHLRDLLRWGGANHCATCKYSWPYEKIPAASPRELPPSDRLLCHANVLGAAVETAADGPGVCCPHYGV